MIAEPIALFLLALAGLFLVGTIAELICRKTGVPDAASLILAGAVLGPVSGVVTRAQAEPLIPYLGTVALVIILFDAGTRIRASELAAAPRAVLLSLLAFGFSVPAVAAVSMVGAASGILPAGWTWVNGLLLGAAVGGPSTAVLAPVVNRIRVGPALGGVMNLESALSDALCVIGVAALAALIPALGPAGPVAGKAVFNSLVPGLAYGVLAGLVWLLFVRAARLTQHAYPITLAMLLLMYVIIGRLGGSPILGILALSVVLGNAPAISRLLSLPSGFELGQDVMGIHQQVVFIIKSFFFVLLGVMILQSWGPAALGAVAAAVLFAARIPAVSAALLGGPFSRGEQAFAAFAMPRGLASIVMATMLGAWNVPGMEPAAGIVFPCVAGSVLIFSLGVPLARRQIESADAAAVSAVSSALWSTPPPPPPSEPPPRPPLTTGKFHW